LFWMATSYVASAITYTVLSWWWTSLVWLAVAFVAVLLIVIWNKKKAKNV
jgi:hypothetical protein